MEFTVFGVDILGVVAKFVFLTSILYVLLPPIEVFKDFPRAKKYYGLIVAIVGYFALNARRKLMELYPQYRQPTITVEIEHQAQEDQEHGTSR